MRKSVFFITALVYLSVQSVGAETIMTAQDYAVDSDVVLESAVREVKSIPKDTAAVIGDTVKFAVDEAATAAKGVVVAFKADPIARMEKEAMIEVANAWNSSDDIIFRSYKVTPEVGGQLAEGAEVGESGAIDLSGTFAGAGFPEKSSIYFYPKFNRVMVRNTQANLLKIEQVLGEMHSAAFDLMGKQVEIETKFIEINQSTLNELGFNWNFEGKNGGSANLFDNLTLPAQDLFVQGLRTAGGISAPANIASAVSGKAVAFDTSLNNSDVLKIAKTAGSLRWGLVINALEQADDTDVLSAPSIVTRDGSEASITVGEKRTVSVGFDVNQAESSLYIEHDLESRVMGVQLTVTPTLRADSLIDLQLHPKVIDLVGYEDYQIIPQGATGGVSGENSFSSINTVNAALASRMPYYRLREMETEVTVADGSTVGMGGMIYDKLETFRDKVPMLGSIPLVGRLFRSEGEKSVKRNLMIFVTATQVDVNGRRASDLVYSK